MDNGATLWEEFFRQGSRREPEFGKMLRKILSGCGISLEHETCASSSSVVKESRTEMRRVGPLMFVAWMAAAVAVSAAPADPAQPEQDGAPVAVQHVALPDTGLRDQAMMVLVGSALIGVGAALRRAA